MWTWKFLGSRRLYNRTTYIPYSTAVQVFFTALYIQSSFVLAYFWRKFGCSYGTLLLYENQVVRTWKLQKLKVRSMIRCLRSGIWGWICCAVISLYLSGCTRPFPWKRRLIIGLCTENRWLSYAFLCCARAWRTALILVERHNLSVLVVVLKYLCY